ncbi:AAA family ATPase [Protaetiibacter mangrovi]|uniref:ATP-binding protein n=1 Tax=Protaetiibacter mangrovi TaxID=2970926 RepID=A0ABT1ZHW1_9MICO|nr:ATP-binding protein [Protaetiibacter mangrovi]MCS0500277.1 ATP-binding protein [Protaetiibacter mangrovi]
MPDRPLLERAAELAAIDGALAGAESGSTRTVVVVGEPGIGKSSLLTEGAALAVARGFDVRRAVFTVLSAQTPHGLLWEWFGADAHDEEPGPAFDGPAEMLRDVLRGERTAEPVALAYAAQWALSALDEERPLLLLVDDLQWADEASRRLLTTLVARLSTERIAILIATRPDPALDADPAVAAMLAGARTSLLEPPPLSITAVGSLAEGSDADVERVFAVSGGVPFYVRELIDHGLESGPARIREGLRARLAALPDDARTVVQTAVVVPEGLAPALLADAAGVSDARLAELITQLDAAGLVERRDDVVRPVHPIVVEGVLASLDPDRLAQLHARVADALREAGAPLSAIAAHDLETIPGGDARRAASLADAARLAASGGVARRRGAVGARGGEPRHGGAALRPGACRGRAHRARGIAVGLRRGPRPCDGRRVGGGPRPHPRRRARGRQSPCARGALPGAR